MTEEIVSVLWVDIVDLEMNRTLWVKIFGKQELQDFKSLESDGTLKLSKG